MIDSILPQSAAVSVQNGYIMDVIQLNEFRASEQKSRIHMLNYQISLFFSRDDSEKSGKNQLKLININFFSKWRMLIKMVHRCSGIWFVWVYWITMIITVIITMIISWQYLENNFVLLLNGNVIQRNRVIGQRCQIFLRKRKSVALYRGFDRPRMAWIWQIHVILRRLKPWHAFNLHIFFKTTLARVVYGIAEISVRPEWQPCLIQAAMFDPGSHVWSRQKCLIQAAMFDPGSHVWFLSPPLCFLATSTLYIDFLNCKFCFFILFGYGVTVVDWEYYIGCNNRTLGPVSMLSPIYYFSQFELSSQFEVSTQKISGLDTSYLGPLWILHSNMKYFDNLNSALEF